MRSFNDIIKELDNEFKILGPFDISEFFNSNGRDFLINLLKKCYRPEYKHNERIVLYFDKDAYRYENTPGLLVSALQKIISELDISNWFVVLISADAIVKADLDVVRHNFSTDTRSITHIQCHNVLAIANPMPISNDTLCIRPWIHLFVGTDGNVLPCCTADDTLPVSSIKKANVDDIFNTQRFKNIRKNMMCGKRSAECAVCYDLEEKGVESIRMFENKKWENKFNIIDKTHADGSVYDTKIYSLDFRISNTCNFKCRMCTGYSSSRIQQEEKNNNIIGIQYPTLLANDKQLALKKIIQMIDDVEEISFAGGEPLIIKEHYDILDYLIKNNRTDVQLRYASNFSTLTYKDKNIISYWNKFKNIRLEISIDEENSPANYSRSGTIWSDFEKNYSLIQRECQHVDISIMSTYNIYTAFNLIKLQYNWIKDERMDCNNMFFHILTDPPYLSVRILPTVFKNKLTSLIKQHIIFLKQYNNPKLITLWEEVIAYMNDNYNTVAELSEFFLYNDKLDRIRMEQFTDVYPEYSKLRSYITT